MPCDTILPPTGIYPFFCDLKDFRHIALRTDKTDLSFAATINACAALLNSK